MNIIDRAKNRQPIANGRSSWHLNLTREQQRDLDALAKAVADGEPISNTTAWAEYCETHGMKMARSTFNRVFTEIVQHHRKGAKA